MPEQLILTHARIGRSDLNGWTANNIAPVFLARVAPRLTIWHIMRVLTSSMDAWIVDDNLIPSDIKSQEWHNEKIVRLQTFFLPGNEFCRVV